MFNDSPSSAPAHLPRLAGRAYHCHCGSPVFFRNSTCLACGTALGYDPAQASLLPLMPGEQPDTWVAWQPEDGAAQPDTPPAVYLRCANLHTPAACNWLVPVSQDEPQLLLCQACRLNRTIPDLNDPAHPDNGELWGNIELAKRRLEKMLDERMTPTVRYFLEVFMPSFALTLDEMSLERD